jgi:hypothetical protein
MASCTNVEGKDEAMNNDRELPSGLIIIARDATRQVITRLACTRSRDVLSAMRSAYSVLQLKQAAVCVEVHRYETPVSTYQNPPLAAISQDDLPVERLW